MGKCSDCCEDTDGDMVCVMCAEKIENQLGTMISSWCDAKRELEIRTAERDAALAGAVQLWVVHMSRQELKGTPEERWVAIYAAEFVRRIAEAKPGIRVDYSDELIEREMREAASLADWARENESPNGLLVGNIMKQKEGT